MMYQVFPQKWRENSLSFWLLLYITGVSIAILYAPQPLLPDMRASFGVSEATTSLLTSLSLLPLGFAPIVYGAILGNISARKMLLCSVFLLLLSGIPLCLSQSFTLLAVTRILQGLTLPAVFTAVMTQLAKQSEGERQMRAITCFVGITIAGSLCGRIAAGVLASCCGWRISLLLISLSLVPALPLLFTMPDSHSSFTRITGQDFVAALRHPGIRLMLFIEFWGFFVFCSVTNCLPFRMTELSSESTSLMTSLFYSGYGIGIIFSFMSPRIIRLFGGKARTITCGTIIYLCSILLLPVGNMPLLFVTMWLICTGQYLEHCIGPGLINQMSSLDKGVINGLYLSFYYAGGSIGSYVSVWVYGHLGWGACVAMLAMILLMMLIAVFHVRKYIAAMPQK